MSTTAVDRIRLDEATRAFTRLADAHGWESAVGLTTVEGGGAAQCAATIELDDGRAFTLTVGFGIRPTTGRLNTLELGAPAPNGTVVALILHGERELVWYSRRAGAWRDWLANPHPFGATDLEAAGR